MRSSSPHRARIAAAAGLAVASAFLLAPRAAEASSTFPPSIQSYLSMSSAPSCSICHEGGHTGAGTVTTPFGTAMRARGLVPGDVASLKKALDQMSTDAVDSNANGVTDIDELKAGRDPNGGQGGAVNAPDIHYGCGGAHVAGTTKGGGLFGAAAILGVISLLGLRRRRAARFLGLASLSAITLFAGCYDISYVSSSQCSSGALWTGISDDSTMKPGTACIYCHEQKDGPHFKLAGTMFLKPSDADNCVGATNAKIVIQGADGKALVMQPNEVGNFYTRLDVARPYRAKIVAADGRESVMKAEQTEGDCNTCHTSTGRNGAAGRITIP